MKNAFSLLKALLAFSLLMASTIPSFSQIELNVNAGAYPVFLKPESNYPNTEFGLGGGIGMDLLFSFGQERKLKLTYGLGLSQLWFKEKNLLLTLPTSPEGGYYDHKYRVTDVEPKLYLSYKLKGERISITPVVGAGYSWFFGKERMILTKGEGENLADKSGSMGGSFNLHTSLGFGFTTKSGKTISLQPEFVYRFGNLKPNYYFLGTDRFRPHSLVLRINLLGFFFGKKPTADSHQ